MTSLEPYQGDMRKAFQGRALIVIRTTRQPGAIQVQAQADGLAPAALSLHSE
jgi:beta-galactosidase